jgi:hypothetical protein
MAKQASTKVSINTFVQYRACRHCCQIDVLLSVPEQVLTDFDA